MTPVEFDPDFRRVPKTNTFCEQCGKDIKDTSKAIPVTWDCDTWQAVIGHDQDLNGKNPKDGRMQSVGNGWIGRDCARRYGLIGKGKSK